MESKPTAPAKILAMHGILTPTGEADNHIVSIVSGALTAELINAIWTSVNEDMDALEALESYLWELHDGAQYREAMCAVKTLHLANGLPFAETLETIMRAGNMELLASFLHEFLMDLDDAKFDLHGNEDALAD